MRFASSWPPLRKPSGARTCVAGVVPLYQSSAASDWQRSMQEEILEFWFGRPGTADYGSTRKAWFGKDAAFDAAIAYRFGAAIETALSSGFADWTAPPGMLARILVLDQFTRNGFRDTPRAFAGDALALALAEEAT